METFAVLLDESREGRAIARTVSPNRIAGDDVSPHPHGPAIQADIALAARHAVE
jgi:hypothetical protein